MRRKSSDSFQLVLNGGLGNQLFGYAAGKSIEEETGLVCEFIKPGAGDRSYELHNFGIDALPASLTKSPPLGRTLMNRLINKLHSNKFRYRETSFTFDRRFYSDPSGKTL
jgi:hypothetical protein